MGIEAGRDQNPGRGETLDARADDLVKERQVDIAGAARQAGGD